jgi:hypothetical protein
MAQRSDLSGKKKNIQKSGRHKSGKSRGGSKAFAYKGPHGLRGVKKVKTQKPNLVTVKTPVGKIKVTMKEYKTYFKKAWGE